MCLEDCDLMICMGHGMCSISVLPSLSFFVLWLSLYALWPGGLSDAVLQGDSLCSWFKPCLQSQSCVLLMLLCHRLAWRQVSLTTSCTDGS